MNTRKEKALRALLTTSTLGAAALQAGIGERTLYRYLHNDDEFKGRYEAEKNKLVDGAADMLKQNLAQAIVTLRQVVDDTAAPPAVRVQASRSILEYGLRMVETQDILQRLQALENTTKDGENHGEQ